MKRYLPLIANFIAATIFGFAMLFIKMGMRVVQYDSVKFLAFRFTLGFVVMSLLLVLRFQKIKYKNKPFWLLLCCGALNPLISQVLETTATTYAPTSQIAIVFSLLPIFIVCLSIPINRERPAKKQVVFMAVSVLGIVLINAVGGQPGETTAYGLFLSFAAVAAISLQRVLVRRASAHFTAFETIYVTTGMGAAGFCATTAVTHVARGRPPGYFDCLSSPDFIVSILYMGVMSCVVAFICLTYANGRLPVAVSSSTSIFNSVVSVLVGVFILNESFRAIDVVGAGVTFAGILCMSLSYDASASNKFGAQTSGRIGAGARAKKHGDSASE